MQLMIFGATGGVGSEVVKQALERGLEVSAFVRNPGKLRLTHENLTVIEGDVLDATFVAESLLGHDAAICTLGGAMSKDHFLSRATKAIVGGLEQQGVKRFIVNSTMGVGDSAKQLSLAAKVFVKTVIRAAVAEHARQEEVVRNSSLDWTIVRPGGLGNGGKTGLYQTSSDPDKTLSGTVARADVAHFMLELLDNVDVYQKAISIVGK